MDPPTENQPENPANGAARGRPNQSRRSPPYALFNLLVIVVAIIYAVYYKMYLNDAESVEVKEQEAVSEELKIPRMFTSEELKKYNGEGDDKTLYLAVMGEVFDVTRGEKHYGVGASYHSFVGKDASKAFVTGEDADAKGSKPNSFDHVLSLSPSDLVSLKKWRDFYSLNYDYVGRLIGRFYDADGTPTEYYWSIDRKIQFGLKQQEEEALFKREFPPCNVEYKRDQGTRFWCTAQSGGIERELAGYPIQLFDQDTKTFSCVCTEKENFDLPQLRKYENCDDSFRSCSVSLDDEQSGDYD